MGTCVHDPIYRRLIDEENDEDNNQKRTWCIITYPPSLRIYIYMAHIFHFCGPFIINLISVIILIKKQSRQQYNVHKQQRPYKELHQYLLFLYLSYRRDFIEENFEKLLFFIKLKFNDVCIVHHRDEIDDFS
jgi:hypothetical protein